MISTKSRRELSSSFFFPQQGKAPKEIHGILTEILACLLSDRAKDLSAPLYNSKKGRLINVEFEIPEVTMAANVTPRYDA